MAIQEAVKTKEPTSKTITQKALYWFGALPASVPTVPYQVPTRDRQGNGQYFEVRQLSPISLWNEPARVWVGKCRFYQSLSVKGFSFPAFSELKERATSTDEEMTSTVYPGALKIMRKDEVDRIVSSCFKHIVRYGKGGDDIYSLKNAANGGISPVRILNLDANDEKPPGMTDEEFADKRIMQQEDLSFDTFTDRRVAEFVYLVPLSVEFKEVLDANGDLDLVSSLAFLPHQRINQKFFAEPPRSVAEMYPSEGLPR